MIKISCLGVGVLAVACSGSDATLLNDGFSHEVTQIDGHADGAQGADGAEVIADDSDVSPPIEDPPGRELTEKVLGTPSTGRGAICIRYELAGGGFSSCASGGILNDRTFITAAHVMDALGIFNGPRKVRITYEGPTTKTWNFDTTADRPFVYLSPGWDGSADEDSDYAGDVAVGVLPSHKTFGLGMLDYLPLYTGTIAAEMRATVHGYGQGSNVNHHAQTDADVTSVGSGFIRYETVGCQSFPGFPCTWYHQTLPGDSGGPALRAGGTENALVWLTSTGNGGGRENENNSGVGPIVKNHRTWINEIVEFWTPWTCQSGTTQNGLSVARCWAEDT